LVVDTDVASFVFKWHPDFAPQYVRIIRGFGLVLSFMTLAEMRQGALNANWGQRKRDLLEEYLGDFSVLHSGSHLCFTWAAIRNESVRKGAADQFSRCVDRCHRAGSADSARHEQSQGLPPSGQPQLVSAAAI
jgi:predicted nucleic acid-binding protein